MAPVNVAIRADRSGDVDCLVPSGAFDLAHVAQVVQAVDTVAPCLEACRSVEVDLAQVDNIDGTGAALLARLLDRLESCGCRTQILQRRNPEAARLIALYRGRGSHPPAQLHATNALERIGTAAAELPGKLERGLDFIGRCAAAVPKAITNPGCCPIGDHCRGWSRRSEQTRSLSRAQPTCWLVSSSVFLVSRSSGASVRLHTCPSLLWSRNFANWDRLLLP